MDKKADQALLEENNKNQGEKVIQQTNEAGLPTALDALPVGAKFNIEFVGEGRFSDELSGYHQYGQITIGEKVIAFSNVSTQGSMQDSDYERQWKEAAQRIVSGHDRAAFITNDGGGGWGTAFGGRWLMWREGERVYVAPDDTPVDSTSNAGPGIESLQSKCARSTADLSALSLQAIEDFLGPHSASQFTSSTSQPAVVSAPHAEADWLECGEDGPGLAISKLRHDPSRQRKLFLAGCAWARRFWDVRLGRRSKTAVEVYERFADGEAPAGTYEAAWSRFAEMFAKHGDYFAWMGDVKESESDFFTALIQARAAWQSALPYVKDDPAAEAAIVLPARGVYSLGRGAYLDASDEFAFASGNQSAEYYVQCNIIRDVFGPFRQVSLEATWLTSKDGAVARIAGAIYEERAFDRMTELADALENSGCKNRQILEHCRSQGEHVRGCWVIDLLLGKDKIEFSFGARMPLALQVDIDTIQKFLKDIGSLKKPL